MEHPIPEINYSFSKRYGVVVSLNNESDDIVVLHRPDLSSEGLLELHRCLQMPFTLEEVDEAAFNKELARAYDRGSGQAVAAVEDLDEDDLSLAASDLAGQPEDLLESEDDAPIIRLINAIFSQAIKENASDIHIESFEERMVVRIRVDGVLKEIVEPPRQIAPLVISRIKIMGKLDIAERRIPQDGRISLRVAGRNVDVRVSTLPSGQGERVVMRLLDKQMGRLNLSGLGLFEEQNAAMCRLIARPHGIVLVTGPTGSGKTTSLYSALMEINEPNRNILTVEDPIEYYLDGIGQTQVNTKVDMTFARGLRAILRQDPDVVMIGEIRDLETGDIAIQASLTGHLVLSTLHTNTALGSVARLYDMGIEPFLLSSSLAGLMSQRLVRRLNPACREAYQSTEFEMDVLGLSKPVTLYRPKEEGDCQGKGYLGRMGIFEIIEVDSKLQRMIHQRKDEQAMEDYVRNELKIPSLFDDGVKKALNGETTLAEVMRVTTEE